MSRKHLNNPDNLQPGEIVRLDKNFRNASDVKIVSLTPNHLFAFVNSSDVKDPKQDDCWDVMTNRLTKIE